MNAQPNGGSPGGAPAPQGGTPAPAGTTPTPDPQAQAGQQQSGVTLEQLRAEIRASQDSTFANVRKMVEGIVGRGQGATAGTTPPAGTPGAQAQAATPMAAADVQQIIARHSAFTRAVAGSTLSEGQLARMERAFQLEAPEDVTGWAKGYLADFGLDRTSSAAGAAGTQPPSGQQQPPPGPPRSDAGGAAAPPRNLDGVNLFTMSEADRVQFIKDKGLDAYRKALVDQSRTVTVKLR